MQKNPHHADRGDRSSPPTRPAPTARSSTSAASTRCRPTSSTRRSPRRATAGYLGERILGSDHTLSLVVHRGAGAYICGEETGAARLARGQARQPAPEAAVPGQPGPLPGPDADQQRRDAARPSRTSSAMGGAEYAKLGVRDLDRHEARLGLGPRAAPGQLRDRARHPVARDHLRPGRRAAGGPRGQVLVPRRLVLAGADGRRPRPPLRLRLAWPRPARCSARARSSSSTTRRRSSTSR